MGFKLWWMVRRTGIFVLSLLAFLSCSTDKPSVHLENGTVVVNPSPAHYVYLLKIRSLEPLRIEPIVMESDSTIRIEASGAIAFMYAWEMPDSTLHFSPENILPMDSTVEGLKSLTYLLAGDTAGFVKAYEPPHLMSTYLEITSPDDSTLSKMLIDSLSSSNPLTLFHTCISALRILKDTAIASRALGKLDEDSPMWYRCRVMLLLKQGRRDEASAVATSSRLYDQPYLHEHMEPESIPKEWKLIDDILRSLYYADSITPTQVKELETLVEDPVETRRNLLFFQTGRILGQKNIRKTLKKSDDISRYYLASLYMKAGDTSSALTVIRNRLKSAPIEDIAPWWYELLLEASSDSSEKLNAMAYLAYYYGWPEYRESIESIAPDRADSLRKSIQELLPEAPPVSGKTVDGKEIKWEDLKGRTVVLNFWATWCGPCRREIPHLNELVKEFGDDSSIVFIAITKEDRKTVEKFLKEHPFDYTILVDGNRITRDYGVMAFPTHYVINREGRIVFNQIGYTPELTERLREVLLMQKGSR